MRGGSAALLVGLGIAALTPACAPEHSPENRRLETALDTTRARIGDRVHFNLRVRGANHRRLHFPPWTPSDSVQVRSREIVSGGLDYEIVFWDTGWIEIPSQRVEILHPDSSLDRVLTSVPVVVQVISTIRQDTTFQRRGVVQLKPIKGPVPLAFLWPWRVIILAAILVILVGGIVVLWTRRKPPELEKLAWRRQPSPDSVALEQLRRYQASPFQDRAEIKGFYSHLSHLLREYVEHSLFIKTLEMTTEEIGAYRDVLPFEDHLVADWLEVLKRADLVKYARFSPAGEACRQDLVWAEAFIHNTTVYWKPPALAGPLRVASQ